MGLTCLKEAGDEDDRFLYEVFCTTWESEIAALPNPSLANHILRIQFTAQNRRFESRHPNFQRYVIVHEGEPAGRLYLQRTESAIQVLDTTLLPEFRSQGIGREVIRGVLGEAARDGKTVTLRVARRNIRARTMYQSAGFRLVTMDDLDCYLEWSPDDATAE